MPAYTVEIEERTVVFVPSARDGADAEKQAAAWIEVDAMGAVRVSGPAQPVEPGRESDERLLADTEIVEA